MGFGIDWTDNFEDTERRMGALPSSFLMQNRINQDLGF